MNKYVYKQTNKKREKINKCGTLQKNKQTLLSEAALLTKAILDLQPHCITFFGKTHVLGNSTVLRNFYKPHKYDHCFKFH